LRAIGVVGYKNSGKTTLTLALIGELASRGHRVAAVKHTSEKMDLLDKDTARLGESAHQVGFVSPEESGVFIRGESRLDDILVHLDADLVVIEGFKRELSYPKIACLSGREEDRNLFNGLVICAAGPGDQAPELSDPAVQYLNRDAIGAIADLAEKRAFKLPNLNCGGCGFEDCYGLAREIVAGAKSAEDCVSLHPEAELLVDGKPVPLNPFISELFGNVVRAMVSTLRGFHEGSIEIKIG